MKLFAICIFFCISATLAIPDLVEIKNLEDASRNEIDNNVNNEQVNNNYQRESYDSNTESQHEVLTDFPTTPAPLDKNGRPMPTTGCFGHLPEDHNQIEEQEGTPAPNVLSDHQENNQPAPNFRPVYRPTQAPFYTSHSFPHHNPWMWKQYAPNNPWSTWRRPMSMIQPGMGPQFYPENGQYSQMNPWSQWRRHIPFAHPGMGPQFYPQNNQFIPNSPWSQWRRHMSYFGPQMGPHMGPHMGPYMGPYMRSQMGPQMGSYMSPQMGAYMGPYMRSQMGPQMGPHFFPQNNFFPNNPWSPWRRHLPFVGPPSAPQFIPQNPMNHHPMVIVKLLQPIILPVAKPFYPERGERDPDSEDVDSQKLISGGFRSNHRFGQKRFEPERARMIDHLMTHRRSIPKEYGPFKINGDDIRISLKLH